MDSTTISWVLALEIQTITTFKYLCSTFLAVFRLRGRELLSIQYWSHLYVLQIND